MGSVIILVGSTWDFCVFPGGDDGGFSPRVGRLCSAVLKTAEINCQIAFWSEIVWSSVWAGCALHFTES